MISPYSLAKQTFKLFKNYDPIKGDKFLVKLVAEEKLLFIKSHPKVTVSVAEDNPILITNPKKPKNTIIVHSI
jgi:hypothetical protein